MIIRSEWTYLSIRYPNRVLEMTLISLLHPSIRREMNLNDSKRVKNIWLKQRVFSLKEYGLMLKSIDIMTVIEEMRPVSIIK